MGRTLSALFSRAAYTLLTRSHPPGVPSQRLRGGGLSSLLYYSFAACVCGPVSVKAPLSETARPHLEGTASRDPNSIPLDTARVSSLEQFSQSSISRPLVAAARAARPRPRDAQPGGVGGHCGETCASASRRWRLRAPAGESTRLKGRRAELLARRGQQHPHFPRRSPAGACIADSPRHAHFLPDRPPRLAGGARLELRWLTRLSARPAILCARSLPVLAALPSCDSPLSPPPQTLQNPPKT